MSHYMLCQGNNPLLISLNILRWLLSTTYNSSREIVLPRRNCLKTYWQIVMSSSTWSGPLLTALTTRSFLLGSHQKVSLTVCSSASSKKFKTFLKWIQQKQWAVYSSLEVSLRRLSKTWRHQTEQSPSKLRTENLPSSWLRNSTGSVQSKIALGGSCSCQQKSQSLDKESHKLVSMQTWNVKLRHFW